MEAYFRGSLVNILEIYPKYTWIQFPGSNNSRKVLNSDLMTVHEYRRMRQIEEELDS